MDNLIKEFPEQEEFIKEWFEETGKLSPIGILRTQRIALRRIGKFKDKSRDSEISTKSFTDKEIKSPSQKVGEY